MTVSLPTLLSLPPVLALSSGNVLASAIILVVALIALVLTFMTLRAYRSAGNRRILFVLWAFALFAAKGGALVAGILLNLEASLLFIAAAVVDLIIVILLITPFFR